MHIGRTLNLETRFGGAMRGSDNTFCWTKKRAVSSTHACATRRNAELVGNAIILLLQPLIDLLHIITGDNGKEFADHERIDKVLNNDFLVCHYPAKERGAYETLNGLVRQDILKDHDIATATDQELEILMDKLNHYQRKCLDFQTPFEAFFDQSIVAILS